MLSSGSKVHVWSVSFVEVAVIIFGLFEKKSQVLSTVKKIRLLFDVGRHQADVRNPPPFFGQLRYGCLIGLERCAILLMSLPRLTCLCSPGTARLELKLPRSGTLPTSTESAVYAIGHRCGMHMVNNRYIERLGLC
ncbi:hypothetical protein K443DRAFT_238574 [Laccaria amethystina LaAM-08-1]|jgi:hypothetical protein|uniref:Uncharacterized protein n=1 Tax=Laccaria amethystina LaAM-08-1 TaxID=1095629 RepID=A0A0C9XJ85_9AGAR|nr:hypothetical protein K443DRAFT_238574 [Laccaria amethystina LaAM-08-1]